MKTWFNFMLLFGFQFGLVFNSNYSICFEKNFYGIFKSYYIWFESLEFILFWRELLIPSQYLLLCLSLSLWHIEWERERGSFLSEGHVLFFYCPQFVLLKLELIWHQLCDIVEWVRGFAVISNSKFRLNTP